tara:strand:- start:760 stop:1818 length:1059 start_codon:yes stop_codon:yes gene_type:complete
MKNKLKILFLAPGTSSHSFKWINFFSKKYDIHWFYETSLRFKVDNIKCYKIKNGISLIFQPIIFFIKVLIIKPDLIHIHSISKNLFISFLVVIFFRKKIILNPWGSDVFFPNMLVKFLQVFIRNNIIFTDSFIIKKKFEKKNKVFKINFGVDLNFFNKSNNKKALKKKIIFCPRGYDPIYNQFLVLNFIKMYKDKLKNFLFVFSGSIHMQEFTFFKKFIKKYKLQKIVNLNGNLNKIEYKKYLINSFLVISASKSDAGLSSSIAEAMSSKCLVLCSNNRDNPYWIKNNLNGFLFKDNDDADFKKMFFYIMSLTQNEKVKIELKARNTQENKNNFFLEMDKVEKLYKKIYLNS